MGEDPLAYVIVAGLILFAIALSIGLTLGAVL